MGGKKHTAKSSFAGIPRHVIQHPDYQALSGNAVKLLVDLAYQYRGKNNGDLTTAWHVLKHRRWKSRQTIDRSKKELLDRQMIIQTRTGRFLNPGGQCALYALAWAPIDDCTGKNLEIKPTVRPPHTFRLEDEKDFDNVIPLAKTGTGRSQ